MKTSHCFILGIAFLTNGAAAEAPVTGASTPAATSPVVAQDALASGNTQGQQGAGATAQQAAPNPYMDPLFQAWLKRQKNSNSKSQPLPNLEQLFSQFMKAYNPDENTDWSKYEYPDDKVFGSGQRGAGNIGNGLCTSQNQNRTQVKNGYCRMLSDILRDPNSCANRAMNSIIAKGNSVAHLGEYCSTFPRMGSNKSEVFVQFLAALITNESGWNAHATEKAWSKNGQTMQGRGLFQIGVNDRSKDPDCAGLTSDSIYDAKTNMRCGACIALKFIDQDNNMGDGTGDSGARGAARYFGPLRDMQANKRRAMASAVNNYCVASTGGGGSSSQMALGGSGASR